MTESQQPASESAPDPRDTEDTDLEQLTETDPSDENAGGGNVVGGTPPPA